MGIDGSGLGLDDFLDHRTGGGGGSFLGNWRKDPGKVKVWLHTKARIFPMWGHGWAIVKEIEDRESGEKSMGVFGMRFNCHERELILRKQHFRDRKTDEREYPPEVCPHCLMIEAIRAMVRDKKLSWTDPVFVFEGDDPERTITMHAGGIFNAFGRKNPPLTQTEKAELRRAGIRRDEAFKENNLARLQYLFTVLADVSDGVQITPESAGLGNKMKKAIRDEMRRSMPKKEDGDPTINPYPFEWTYDEDADFDDKYDVVALTKEEPTDEILALIRDEDPPDNSRIVAPGNCLALYNSMKEHVVEGIDLPWDDIFGEAEKRGLMKEEEPESFPGDEAEEGEEEAGGDAPEVGRDAPASEAELEVELFECDHCKGELKAIDLVCPHCNAEYNDEGKLSARPCLKCNYVIQFPEKPDEARTICEKCGTIFEVDTWKVVPSPVQQAAAPPAKRSRSAAVTSAPVDPNVQATPTSRARGREVSKPPSSKKGKGKEEAPSKRVEDEIPW